MVKDAYTVEMMEEGLSAETLAMLACPVCHGTLRLDAGNVHCLSCGRKYPIEDGIPILLAERAQSS
jgi:uncharacterized protein